MSLEETDFLYLNWQKPICLNHYDLRAMHSDLKNNVITNELFKLPNSGKENSHPFILCQSINKSICHFEGLLLIPALLFPTYFQILNAELYVIFGLCFFNSVLDTANF